MKRSAAMSAWSSATDIKVALDKKWQKQALLKEWLAGDLIFPMEISIKRPKGRELLEQYAQAAEWIDQWQRDLSELDINLSLIYETVSNRHIKVQQIPRYLRIENAEQLWQWLGYSDEVVALSYFHKNLTQQWPCLDEVIKKSPFKFIQLVKECTHFIKVLEWFEDHPHSALYLRQLDIEGVHTKFIEAHKGLIDSCLQVILPPRQFNTEINSLIKNGFEKKYGLSYDAPMIRFRILDEAYEIQGLTDLTLPLDDFITLSVSMEHIFITENKINGLAFPQQKNAMVIFGLGYGIDLLEKVVWLADKHIWYWGDIDTHGFNILSQLRKYWPQTKSLLMDKETLLACKALWVEEAKPMARFNTSNLSTSECEVLEGIWQQRWQASSLRLEQEVIPFNCLRHSLETINVSV